MIDPNEAPPGCVAVESVSCHGCYFNRKKCSSITPSCLIRERKDRTPVIFKRLESQKRGIAEILADMEKLVAEMRRLM